MHFLHKKRSAFSPDFVGSDERKFLTFGVTGVIISIESEREERRKASEKSSKNLLTNRFQSAIIVIEDKRWFSKRQGATVEELQKIFKKLLTSSQEHGIIDTEDKRKATAVLKNLQKKFLTNSLKSAIIEVQRGEQTSVSNFRKFEKKFKKPLDKQPKV